MFPKKILFVVGSMNQTTQMHQIAKYLLPDYDCYFTQFYGNSPLVRFAKKIGLLENSIMSGQFKRNSEKYLKDNGLKLDYRAQNYKNDYELAVLCTDLIVPKELRRIKTVFVQEGMTDQLTPLGRMVNFLKLPGYLAIGTALNGAMNTADIYCVASEGYQEHFSSLGTDFHKIIVTGIPNYDNAESFLNNDFPHKDYIMVATSDIREVFGKEDRRQFIRECVKIADGRQLLFKLHPNEKFDRAYTEIKEEAPENTLIFQQGSTNEMIANCKELITQYSTVVYIGIALGKKVYSFFDVEKLKKLSPIQNGGHSAENIAHLCRTFIEYQDSKKDFLNHYQSYKTAQ